MKNIFLKLIRTLFLTFVALVIFSCTDLGTPIDIAKENLTLRQLIATNYQNSNFIIGTRIQTSFLSMPALYKVYAAEFKGSSPDSVFSQEVVYPDLGGSWFRDKYNTFFTDARRQSQFLRVRASISSECSPSAKSDDMSATDLEALMTHYLTTLSTDLEANKDVIKWMDVVDDAIVTTEVKGLGYNRESTTNTVTYPVGSFLGPRTGTNSVESPWAYLGFDTIAVQGSPFVMPKYISKAFAIANQNAPNVKKLFVQGMDDMNPLVWNNVRNSILAMRSKGIRVDGIGWRGSVSLGWEKNTQNLQQLSMIVDWCYLNNVEFYITSLEVKVSDIPNDNDNVIVTAQDQANTIQSIVQIMATKAGNGAAGIWFGLFTGESVNGKTYGNLFNAGGEKTVVYNSVNSILLSK